MKEAFRKFAMSASKAMGSPLAFLAGILGVAGWAAMGPAFHYSENWQLIINTSTTIITFLMVFVIQYSQNRDTETLHLKIDELLRVIEAARTDMVNLENQSDERIQSLKDEFSSLTSEECAERKQNVTAV